MVSSPYHSSSKTLTSPLTSLVTSFHLTESKSFTQLELSVSSDLKVSITIPSLVHLKELTTVSYASLKSALLDQTRFHLPLPDSSSWEMELTLAMHSACTLLKDIPTLTTSSSRPTTLTSIFQQMSATWWPPTPSCHRLASTLETWVSRVSPTTTSTVTMSDNKSGPSNVNSDQTTLATSQMNGTVPTWTTSLVDVSNQDTTSLTSGAKRSLKPLVVTFTRLEKSGSPRTLWHRCTETLGYSSDM